MKLTHVITDLSPHGAQRMLYNLIAATPDVEHSVVSLSTEGAYGPAFERLGIPVVGLGMRKRARDLLAVARLARLLRRGRPDLVQGWMYHANLVGGVASVLARRPMIWGIRHSSTDPRQMKRVTHGFNVMCARLSRVIPERIVCCAGAALRSHVALGYRPEKMAVIPNGFDLSRFAPDAAARARIRAELAIAANAPVIGLLARFHPDKDHRTFLSAAELVANRHREAVFVLAGVGVDPGNRTLSGWIREGPLGPRVRLLGDREDVPALLSGLDVLALSSRTEGFPQVLGEAMACEVPCVATDCGDAREIVADTGRIAPVRDAAALAAGLSELLELTASDRRALGARARRRVEQNYSLAAVARRYLELYDDVLARSSRVSRRQWAG